LKALYTHVSVCFQLYPQIDAICPGQFGSWWSYTAKYCDAKLEWFGKNKRRNVKYEHVTTDLLDFNFSN